MIQVNKQLEQLKIIEPILKNIDKDIKNNMKLKDLKKSILKRKKIRIFYYHIYKIHYQK